MSPRLPLPRVVPIVACCLALALASGCGGGDDGSETGHVTASGRAVLGTSVAAAATGSGVIVAAVRLGQLPGAPGS
jgi:hypothetical protein